MISCASNNANDQQINWCRAKLNTQLITLETKQGDREQFAIDFTNRQTALNIFLDEINAIEDRDSFYVIYANGNITEWNKIKIEFYEDLGYTIPASRPTFTPIESYKLNIFLLRNGNESALRICKIWEELSY